MPSGSPRAVLIQLNGQGGRQTWSADLCLPADCHLWVIMCVQAVCLRLCSCRYVSFIRPLGLFSQTSQQSKMKPSTGALVPASSQQVRTSLLWDFALSRSFLCPQILQIQKKKLHGNWLRWLTEQRMWCAHLNTKSRRLFQKVYGVSDDVLYLAAGVDGWFFTHIFKCKQINTIKVQTKIN